MSKQKLISLLAVIVLAAAGLYIYIYGGLRAPGEPQAAENAGAPALGENAVDRGTLTEEYANPDFGFSFRYPKDFTLTELEDEAGVTVLLQKEGARPVRSNAPEETVDPLADQTSNGAREGFQIYISEFDEAGPITPERIKQDLPDMVINSPQQVSIGEVKDITALIFLSKHESLGDVREVWFAANGLLYQLTAYADMDNFIGPILETWKFQ